MDASWWKNHIMDAGPISLIMFFVGFFTSRFTMTKKEKKDLEQKRFENAKDLAESQNERFQDFTATLKKYIENASEPTFNDFYDIATSGEKYFYQQAITCEAILSGNVDGTFRDQTLVPKIRETIQKSLPRFYDVLNDIAKKKGFSYEGKLERKQYESLYQVAEKYPMPGDKAPI